MNSFTKKLLIITIAIITVYGLGRLYYRVTDGFTIGNMTSDFVYHPEWETRPLTQDEHQTLDSAIDQSYSYLGKGCQAYVFQSQDGKYVIKFFKYQRFRLKPWESYLPSVSFIDSYRYQKLLKKQKKLENFLSSWVVAFDDLKSEAGLIYVHLNKSTNLKKMLLIRDKIGMEHQVDLDQYEFCVQKKAVMLSDALLRFKRENKLTEAKQLILRLIDLLVSDYKRGFRDNDPALMQNTGVVDGYPIYVDIGQLVKDEKIKNPEVYQPILKAKMQELDLWLQENYPEARF